jgi:hypothetical protein
MKGNIMVKSTISGLPMPIQLIISAAFLFGFAGWAMNIVKLLMLHEVDAEMVIRVVGVFSGIVGAIYGWF